MQRKQQPPDRPRRTKNDNDYSTRASAFSNGRNQTLTGNRITNAGRNSNVVNVVVKFNDDDDSARVQQLEGGDDVAASTSSHVPRPVDRSQPVTTPKDPKNNVVAESERITITSTQNIAVESDISHWTTNSSCEVYVREMLPHRHGFPLWLPQPYDELPLEYRLNGVAIGDVGIITQDGGFDYLFNIWLASSHPMNPPDLPSDFDALTRPQKVTSRSNMLGPNSHISSGGLMIETDAQMIFSFICNEDEGAILALPDGAFREDIKKEKNFESFIRNSAESWYKYASRTAERVIDRNSLYLVTGYLKSSTWAIATYHRRMPEPYNVMKLAISTETQMRRYIWRQSSGAMARTGPAPDDEIDCTGIQYQNQCLFLRGFKIALSEQAWADVSLEAAEEVGAPSGSQLPDNDAPRGSSNAGPSGASHPGAGNTGPRGNLPSQSSREYRKDGVEISSFPSKFNIFHPSDYINEMLLERHPEATIAFTHDDVWCTALEHFNFNLSDKDILIEHIDKLYESHCSDGIAMLKIRAEYQLSESNPTVDADIATKHSTKEPSSLRHPASYISSSPHSGGSNPPSDTRIPQDSQSQSKELPSSHTAIPSSSRHISKSKKAEEKDEIKKDEAWVRTRNAVAQAVRSVLDPSDIDSAQAEADLDIASVQSLLDVAFDSSDFAPVPALKAAGVQLLQSWDASQGINMNRHACLRLAERCARILLSIQQSLPEVTLEEMGPESAISVPALEESFKRVYSFFVKQAHQPFIKLYLRRDESLKEIRDLDLLLTDAMADFSISIQTRILKQALDSQRQSEIQQIPSQSLPRNDRQLLEKKPSDTLGQAAHKPTPAPPTIPTTTFSENDSSSTVFEKLRAVQIDQNSLDSANDIADLQGVLREALQTNGEKMLEVLQIEKDEMPEAIKTLQRTLEKVVEKDQQSETGDDGNRGKATGGKEINDPILDRFPLYPGLGTRGRMLWMPKGRNARRRESKGRYGRSRASLSTISFASSFRGKNSREQEILYRELLESFLDSLKGMSGAASNLPSWTITKFEIDRESKIAIGEFSDIYKGRWRGQTVAIKVLARETPRALFVREVSIWKMLKHPNVLELFGASSTKGDPPWFFVSPYERNGNISQYLRKLESDMSSSGRSLTSGSDGNRATTSSLSGPAVEGVNSGKRSATLALDAWEVPRECDLWRFMQEIATGMEYLHSQNVLHGDLKGANVLVNDQIHCVISDFGQSELKSEAFRLDDGRHHRNNGTLRWQAPELLSGTSVRTPQSDVYAYAICCVEVLSMGKIPWPMLDDNSVRHAVLKEKSRPQPPPSRFNSLAVQELLRICWQNDPKQRPSFAEIVLNVKQLRRNAGWNPDETPEPWLSDLQQEDDPQPRLSPDLKPQSLPLFAKAQNINIASGIFNDVSGNMIHISDDPLAYTSSRPPSITSSLSDTHSPSDEPEVVDPYDGYDSPPPVDDHSWEIKNERRYRLNLEHTFHPSLTLPLWQPSYVELGAVGFHSKPKGEFVTLFNMFSPHKSSKSAVEAIPSIYRYGNVRDANQRTERRNLAQRGVDALSGFLKFRNKGGEASSQSIRQRFSFPLLAGHKKAVLCTESTDYRYLLDLNAPKRWFKDNVDRILQAFEKEHHIQKEDLLLVIGTLNTPDYGLFISHALPDGQVNFDAFASPKAGQPWGKFTIDFDSIPVDGGEHLYASKVSLSGEPWKSVLLARLRFKPDSAEPTSL